MKKISLLFIIIPAIAWGWTVGGITIRFPSSFNISTYAIGDYSHTVGCDCKDIPRTIGHKDRFVGQITNSINEKYPNIVVSHVRDRVDASATVNSFLNENTDDSEIVFFSGHGNSMQSLAFYDRVQNFGIGTKRFGGRTRWVFLDACMFLNVNKEDRLNADLSVNENLDDNKKAVVASMFNGVHAILGHYASTSGASIRKHWYSTARWRTDDQFNYFAQYFIKDGNELWDLYMSAIKKVYKNFSENSAVGYVNPIKGFRPAIAYVRANINGKEIDTSQEKFENMYDAPITSYNQVRIKAVAFGSPEYY